MLRTLQRLVDDNYQVAYQPLKQLHEQAKNKKTMVIRELIETTMNRSFQAFYKWANYNTYAKVTEMNVRKMNLLRDAIETTQEQVKSKLMRMMLLAGKFKVAS